jgi:hypothetical protein
MYLCFPARFVKADDAMQYQGADLNRSACVIKLLKCNVFFDKENLAIA